MIATIKAVLRHYMNSEGKQQITIRVSHQGKTYFHPAGLEDVNVNVLVKLANNGFNENVSVGFVAGQTAHIIARSNQTGCDYNVELLLGE